MPTYTDQLTEYIKSLRLSLESFELERKYLLNQLEIVERSKDSVEIQISIAEELISEQSN